MMSKKIELVPKRLPAKKTPGPGFTGEYCKRHKEELRLILLKLFQNNWRGENSPKLIYEASIFRYKIM